MFCVYFIVHAFGYKRRGFAVINIDNISYWVVKNMILRFRPCWGGRTGLIVRASDSGSGDPGSILGRVGVFVSLSKRHLLP